MLYLVSAEMDKSDYLAFARVHFSNKTRSTRISALVLSVLAELLLAWYVFGISGTDNYLRVMLVFFPILAAFALFLPRLAAAGMAKANRDGGRTEMAFGEDEVTLQTPKGRFTYYYSGFDSIYHSPEAYYVYVNKQQAIIVPGRSFTWGDPATFGAFLSAKTGLPVKEVR